MFTVAQSSFQPKAENTAARFSTKKLKYLKATSMPRLMTILMALTDFWQLRRPSNRSMSSPLTKLNIEVKAMRSRNLQSHHP